MIRLILAIILSALPFMTQAKTLPVVFGDEELSIAREIKSLIATRRGCAGVSVINQWTKDRLFVTEDHLQLVLPNPQQPRDGGYTWALQKWVGGKLSSTLATGIGRPMQIADQVCIAVKGVGAQIQ